MYKFLWNKFEFSFNELCKFQRNKSLSRANFTESDKIRVYVKCLIDFTNSDKMRNESFIIKRLIDFTNYVEMRVQQNI